MPTVEQLRTRLIEKLKELFQLDQPDLDFGFFRIMHAKASQVTRFLEEDLLRIISEAFGHIDDSKRAELKKAYEDAIETARKYGAPDPELTDAVCEARAKYQAAGSTAGAEAEVYDHLYRFFERYYDNGDFISRRYYSRETSTKAAPFAIPYHGEEVKLHWANADQYYIKTSEYFTNFTFDLSRAKEVCEFFKGRTDVALIMKPRRVHFRIVEATEGEHGNVKPTEEMKRFFIIHKADPVGLDENGELVVRFEYRSDPDKGSTQEGTWRDHRNGEAVQTVLKALEGLQGGQDYLRLFKIPAPTEKHKDRVLLAKYIYKYTTRNTFDYFIHKDLGGFLRRELDFYIKNEIMRLDDIENAEAPSVETYLAKVKVLRKIARKIIDFLAQLEDFQKKLWLKKKFVVETNYCITLDRIPEEFYPEIAANEAQREEWVRLYAINEMNDNEPTSYSEPLTLDFLQSQPYIMLDTRYFSKEFKAQLLQSIEQIDLQCDGLLIKSENFQALRALQPCQHSSVKCAYIDFPYNTGKDGFAYKDAYKHSSWQSFVQDRFQSFLPWLQDGGIFFWSIDENERSRLMQFLESNIGIQNHIGTIVWKGATDNNPTRIAIEHEFVTCWTNSVERVESEWKNRSDETKASMLERYEELKKEYNDTKSIQKHFREWIKENFESLQPLTHYDRIDEHGPYTGGRKVHNPGKEGYRYDVIHPKTGKPCKQPARGYRFPRARMEELLAQGRVIFGNDHTQIIQIKEYLKEYNGALKGLIELDSRTAANALESLFASRELFKNPKPVLLLSHLFPFVVGENDLILDLAAGSGTTGHAVIDLNRRDGGRRKYILIEIADYFHTVMKPRIQKIIYSKDWKDGKPTGRDTGISHCFKYIRLESYEDTLNNLRFDENPARERALSTNKDLREDYLLHYMLDVETRGSQSLLNIDSFIDPTAYRLKVKKPGSDEYEERPVDLIETFNYLIGLRVTHIAAPQSFTAEFKREPDPELPGEQHTKLVLSGRMRQDANGPWWFRKVEGWVPSDPMNPNNGKKDKVLIVWRKLTGDLEKDNAVLDAWFQKNRISTRDFEFDIIYVNGSNNLPNLKMEGDAWKVRLIEEDFMQRMWDVEDL